MTKTKIDIGVDLHKIIDVLEAVSFLLFHTAYSRLKTFTTAMMCSKFI